jgi:hypothetical protein
LQLFLQLTLVHNPERIRLTVIYKHQKIGAGAHRGSRTDAVPVDLIMWRWEPSARALYSTPNHQRHITLKATEDLKFDDPQHSVNASLEQWVEKATAPSIIIASKFEDQDPAHAKMTRPLCPYPQAAKYKGSGNPNDAANFECEQPKK